MRYTLKKSLVAASLAGSLALTATPAGALGLSLGMNGYSSANASSASASSESSASSASASGDRRNTNASVRSDVSVHADATIPARCKNYSGADYDRCVKIYNARADAKSEAKADVDTHGKFVSTVRRAEDRGHVTVVEAKARIMAMLDRAFHAAAKLARRACGAENSDAGLVKQCTDGIKADIQAKVSAMIEAAFTF